MLLNNLFFSRLNLTMVIASCGDDLWGTGVCETQIPQPNPPYDGKGGMSCEPLVGEGGGGGWLERAHSRKRLRQLQCPFFLWG